MFVCNFGIKPSLCSFILVPLFLYNILVSNVHFRFGRKATSAVPVGTNRNSYPHVFVVTQYWGEGYFHSIVENMPRIVLYIDFLLANPDIRIHVKSSPKIKELMKLYHLDPARIVTGTIQADVIYVPQGGSCTRSACSLCVRMMADMFAKISSTLNPTDPPSAVDLRLPIKLMHSSSQQVLADYVVLIQRSSKRYLRQHAQIEIILKDISKEFNLTYVLYPDKPVPRMRSTLDIFRRALLVVAPHGAGLSNIVFAPSGVFVVEVLSRTALVHCYMSLCEDLGHRYHGILSSTPNPAMSVDLKYLVRVIKLFLTNRYK